MRNEGMTMPDLKPCPFCGGTQQHIETDGRLWFDYGVLYAVVCLCGARSYQSITEEKAIEAWNRRAGDDAESDVSCDPEWKKRMMQKFLGRRSCENG